MKRRKERTWKKNSKSTRKKMRRKRKSYLITSSVQSGCVNRMMGIMENYYTTMKAEMGLPEQ